MKNDLSVRIQCLLPDKRIKIIIYIRHIEGARKAAKQTMDAMISKSCSVFNSHEINRIIYWSIPISLQI